VYYSVGLAMPTLDPKLRVTQRHLPHWTLEGAIYFVTMRLRTRHLNAARIRMILDHIVSGDNRFYELDAAVVMPDHVHLLLAPVEGYTLSRVMRGIKGTTARMLNLARRRRGLVWRDESFDRIVRRPKEFEEKVNYMYLNPVKAGLTKDPDNYVGWYRKKD
jgi:REP element-mobilizing transposase RayT